MADAGISRATTYVTNAVKHFKFIRQNNFRLHQKPSGFEMNACRPWLEAELTVIKPKIIVALGVTAAQSLLGKAVVLRDIRGRFLTKSDGSEVLVTTHPSAILRAYDDNARQRDYTLFVEDLRKVAGRLGTLNPDSNPKQGQR